MMLFYRYYYLVLAFQAFCIYHAYKNNAEQKWYWFIIFFPVLGSVFYLYDAFYSKQNVENVQEGFKNVVNTGRKLEKLEKEVEFSDSILNKVKLADAYAEYERYSEAIGLYESCLVGFNRSDSDVLSKLVMANYFAGNYEAAVLRGNLIKHDKSFGISENKIAYAWALHKIGSTEKAKEVFEDMNDRFSNYPQRIAFIKFLREIEQIDEADKLHERLLEEFERMDSQERRQKRKMIVAVKSLQSSYKKSSS